MIPGGLGGASRRTTASRARSLNPPGVAKAARPGPKGSGAPRFVQTPQWSAVRRGRARQGSVACSHARAGIPGALYGALLPLLGVKTRSALSFGSAKQTAPLRSKTRSALLRSGNRKAGLSSRGPHPARMAEHAQAKHVLGLDPWMEAGSPSGHATNEKMMHVYASGCLTIGYGRAPPCNSIRHGRAKRVARRPGHPRLAFFMRQSKTWMPGSSPGMTNRQTHPTATNPDTRRAWQCIRR
jgi:hypothetical protein